MLKVTFCHYNSIEYSFPDLKVPVASSLHAPSSPQSPVNHCYFLLSLKFWLFLKVMSLESHTTDFLDRLLLSNSVQLRFFPLSFHAWQFFLINQHFFEHFTEYMSRKYRELPCTSFVRVSVVHLLQGEPILRRYGSPRSRVSIRPQLRKYSRIRQLSMTVTSSDHCTDSSCCVYPLQLLSPLCVGLISQVPLAPGLDSQLLSQLAASAFTAFHMPV